LEQTTQRMPSPKTTEGALAVFCTRMQDAFGGMSRAAIRSVSAATLGSPDVTSTADCCVEFRQPPATAVAWTAGGGGGGGVVHGHPETIPFPGQMRMPGSASIVMPSSVHPSK
jgi:hypothetical protein